MKAKLVPWLDADQVNFYFGGRASNLKVGWPVNEVSLHKLWCLNRLQIKANYFVFPDSVLCSNELMLFFAKQHIVAESFAGRDVSFFFSV